MKIIKAVLMAGLLGISALLWALDLDAAKGQGLLGEQPDGYLGVVKATPDAVELAADVNQRRREAYQRIALQNGITVEQVATLAGQRAIERTEEGHYVRTPTGQWVLK